MTKKVFFGWIADKDEVKDGTLVCRKNNIIKLEFPTSHLRQAGILIFNATFVYFDDNDKIEFLFNNEKLPEWVKPLILDKNNVERIPNGFLDIYTIECVRDIIYKWFEITGKPLGLNKKERIAKIVGLNFHRSKYHKFIDYSYAHPEMQNNYRGKN